MDVLLRFFDLILTFDKFLEPVMRHYGTTIYVALFLFITSVEGRHMMRVPAVRRNRAVYDARTSGRR